MWHQYRFGIEVKYHYITNPNDLGRIANELAKSDVLPFDTETLGFDPHTCAIRLLTIGVPGKAPYVIDLFQTGRPDPIIAVMKEPSIKLGQNLKFDQKMVLHHWGLELDPLFDTFRASALIYNGKNFKHDLWSLYRRELGIEPAVEDLGGSDWSGPLSQAQLDYAADDVINLPALRTVLRQKLIDNGLVKIAKIEFDAILPEAAIELAGFRLDRAAWMQLANDNAGKEAAYKTALLQNLPHPAGQEALPGFLPDINLQSPKQMLQALHRMGVNVANTNEGTLAMVDHPVVKMILDYREYAQCGKSFGASYLSNVSVATGRVHTSFFPFTGCGRYSSSKPNLQQIPRKKEFRHCFAAPPGKALVIADYSQIELRIAAEMANDETLMGVYQRAEDAHTQTAALVSGVKLDEVTKAQRSAAKAINFGLIYGMSADKLPTYSKKGYGVVMSLEEAQTYHYRYFESYQGIKRWHRRIFSRSARAQGITRTIGGRLRYLEPNFYNEYANTPVQGTGADGLKASLRVVYNRLRKYGGKARMVHMVHDEIALETDDSPELLEAAKEDLREGMIEGMQPFLKRVPVVVEVGSGPTWAEK